MPVGYLKQKGILAAQATSYKREWLAAISSLPNSIFRFAYQIKSFATENATFLGKMLLLSARLHELTQALFIETPFEQIVGVFANGKETIQRLTENRITLVKELQQQAFY